MLRRLATRFSFHVLRLAASPDDGRKREKRERQKIRGKDGVQGGNDIRIKQRKGQKEGRKERQV